MSSFFPIRCSSVWLVRKYVNKTNPPPSPKGRQIKLRYVTQVSSRPPTFVVFGNRTDELPESYRRYVVNALRRDLRLGPVPLRLDFRGRSNPFDRGR